MLAATVNSVPCWLLPYHPGGEAIRLTVAMPVDAQRSLTGRSSRRPEQVTPRYSQSWKAALSAAEFHGLRTASLEAQDEPILAPVWSQAYRPASGSAVMDAGLVVAWTEGWVSWAINPGSLAGYDYAAPLLYGRFRQPPRLAAVNGAEVLAEFIVDEDAPAEYSFAPASGILAADTTFPTPSAYEAPLFPFHGDWSDMPKPGLAVTDVDRSAIGSGRIKATTFYPQTPERLLTATLTAITREQEAQLIAWWIRRGGEADSHWVADSQGLWKLDANAAASATTLQLAAGDVAVPAVGANLALTDGSQTEIVTIAGVSGLTLTLADPLTLAWSAARTRICDALFARHTNQEMVLDISLGGPVSQTTLAWREVAPELEPAEGEERGVTLGRLPSAAWFFKLELDFFGAIQTWHLTNWESGATANLIDWAYNACAFDRLTQSIDLEDDECSVTFRYFEDGPWDNWLPGQLAARGYLTIYRADADAAGTFSDFRQVWKGELMTPTVDGAIVKQRAIGDNALFSRRGPRQVMSKTCGTMLFRPRCGLALADWTFSGTITAVSGNAVTIGSITRDNAEALPDGFAAADWFALGWMQWLISGNPMRDGILSSTEISGGSVTVTLERGCTLAVSTSIKFAPGCDHLGPTCREKFANYDNFRGFELMPAVNPSFIMPQRKFQAAKK